MAFPGAYPYRKQDFLDLNRLFLGMTDIVDGYADYLTIDPMEICRKLQHRIARRSS